MKKLFYFIVVLFISSFTACDDIFVEDISDDTMQLVAPANDAVLTNHDVTLVWETMEGAEEYQVIVVSPSFDNILSYVCDSITDDYKLKLTLDTGIYQWSVQGRNSAYVSSKSIGTFEIVD